jgi:hypothetical protein
VGEPCEHRYEQRFVSKDGSRFRVAWCPRCRSAWSGAVVTPDWLLAAPAWWVVDDAGNLQSLP